MQANHKLILSVEPDPFVIDDAAPQSTDTGLWLHVALLGFGICCVICAIRLWSYWHGAAFTAGAGACAFALCGYILLRSAAHVLREREDWDGEDI
jgi:hypothetical protein